jgi:hypothetical protein
MKNYSSIYLSLYFPFWAEKFSAVRISWKHCALITQKLTNSLGPVIISVHLSTNHRHELCQLPQRFTCHKYCSNLNVVLLSANCTTWLVWFLWTALVIHVTGGNSFPKPINGRYLLCRIQISYTKTSFYCNDNKKVLPEDDPAGSKHVWMCYHWW